MDDNSELERSIMEDAADERRIWEQGRAQGRGEAEAEAEAEIGRLRSRITMHNDFEESQRRVIERLQAEIGRLQVMNEKLVRTNNEIFTSSEAEIERLQKRLRADEQEITPQMIAAGVSALMTRYLSVEDVSKYPEIVSIVYAKMQERSRRRLEAYGDKLLAYHRKQREAKRSGRIRNGVCSTCGLWNCEEHA